MQVIAERKEARHAHLAAQRNEQERIRSEKRKQQQEKLTEHRIADAEENESLRKRIQEKIELSCRRHEQTLEDVRIRAQELSSPRPPSGCRWSWSFVDTSHWPSDLPGTNFKCSLCGCELSTEFQAVSHIISKMHLSKTCSGNSDVMTEDLEKEFCSLILQPLTLRCSDDDQSELNWRKKRLKIKQRLAARNKKVVSAEDTAIHPVFLQIKSVRELTNLISKFQQKRNKVEDSTLHSFERILGDTCKDTDFQVFYS
ncbi:hypothetical protein DICVIV_00515 [Dictyocaulus viviparus]|uniref:C2H2-type domain-containing protein n=1 Tax=Dictyocaulus viviparus TaxID=29172 RepID=A0A0D8YB21_DICVI|nr:hypothetical protein DICVIV_00515 [Dictyocaulus viviparus]